MEHEIPEGVQTWVRGILDQYPDITAAVMEEVEMYQGAVEDGGSEFLERGRMILNVGEIVKNAKRVRITRLANWIGGEGK